MLLIAPTFIFSPKNSFPFGFVQESAQLEENGSAKLDTRSRNVSTHGHRELVFTNWVAVKPLGQMTVSGI